MPSNRLLRMSLAGALFGGVLGSAHAIQVVGDAACERYAVDIAAFATCEDGRVVKPETPAIVVPAPDRSAAPKAPAKDDRAANAATLARDAGGKPVGIPMARTR